MTTTLTVALPVRTYKWSYGILTIPSRRKQLERTISSLRIAGFNRPVLFLDGASHSEANNYEMDLGLPVINRMPVIRTFGNWILALWQLYIQSPTADYLAIFNDDIVAYSNLRTYLEARPIPAKGYGNLLTLPKNTEKVLRDHSTIPRTITIDNTLFRWHESNQMGLGAAGLIFPTHIALALLSSREIIDKPLLSNHKAWKNVDGTIVTAMNRLGYKEYVHYPSLINHVAECSSIGNDPIHTDCFWGEDYDATTLLRR